MGSLLIRIFAVAEAHKGWSIGLLMALLGGGHDCGVRVVSHTFSTLLGRRAVQSKKLGAERCASQTANL
eukprot:1975011-Amphidinium_carterae.3